jgi:ribosome biogenesis GTPase
MTPGVMRVAYGRQGLAETADGQALPCHFRRSVGRPLCGDRVQLERSSDDAWSVEAICGRSNVFARADRDVGKQMIAANLDQVLIVIAPRPAPSRDLIERYLVAVHSLRIQPVLVVNKRELLEDVRNTGDSPFARFAYYSQLAYPVVEVSCKTEPGIEPLLPVLRDRISILVGQSGVGKSSLANRLIPNLDLQVRELSRSTGKGTHTTTTTIMYSLPGGGRLIDSPGVWEYGLWTMEPEELERGFPEFEPYRRNCRFTDCRHAGEPGCAVAQALEAGRIADWRYHSYRRLLEQG